MEVLAVKADAGAGLWCLPLSSEHCAHGSPASTSTRTHQTRGLSTLLWPSDRGTLDRLRIHYHLGNSTLDEWAPEPGAIDAVAPTTDRGSIDLEHDAQDRGRALEYPLLVLWS